MAEFHAVSAAKARRKRQDSDEQQPDNDQAEQKHADESSPREERSSSDITSSSEHKSVAGSSVVTLRLQAPVNRLSQLCGNDAVLGEWKKALATNSTPATPQQQPDSVALSSSVSPSVSVSAASAPEYVTLSASLYKNVLYHSAEREEFLSRRSPSQSLGAAEFEFHQAMLRRLCAPASRYWTIILSSGELLSLCLSHCLIVSLIVDRWRVCSGYI